MPYKELRKIKLDKYKLDSDTRDNFQSLETYINNEVFGRTGWEFAEIEIDGDFSTTPYYFKHNADFMPKDVLVTSVKRLAEEASTGTVTINHDNIDEDFITFNCTSPGAIVRFFYGSFEEQKR